VHDTLMTALKISLVIFMAGNLLGIGLRLNPNNAFRGLRNVRFVMQALFWGFAFGPGLACVITLIIPLEYPYAVGLILLGMTPCAPFLPMLLEGTEGDAGFTAALMLLSSAATVIFMPIAVPLVITGLTVSPWAIAKPLLLLICRWPSGWPSFEFRLPWPPRFRGSSNWRLALPP
jgi:bile acid:Na+ symporter, BASS family